MDLDVEVASANRRIQRRIDFRVHEALERIDEPTTTEILQAPRRPTTMADIGRAYGQLARAFSDAADEFARGFQAGRS